MPTYEYACKDCGEHLEIVQSFKDAALTECGRCGGNLRKVFSAAGIIFKGSGYYVTDSRSKPSDGDAKSGASTTSDSGSSDAKASDTKSADSTSSDTTSATSKKSTSSTTDSAKSA